MKILHRALGCMLGGAYGDSLGAAVEFSSLTAIRRRYRQNGITVPEAAFGHPFPVITDDTQMALATGQGLVAASFQDCLDDEVIVNEMYQAYLGWYHSQRLPGESRGPGTTCMSALGSGRIGTIEQPLNHSAGCGGIMRAHPIGLAFAYDPLRAFRIGCKSAAITHGHVNGYVPAGAFALLVALLAQGHSFPTALQYLTAHLAMRSEWSQTLTAVKSAVVAENVSDHGAHIDANIGQTPGRGGGWLGHDALSIALYAVIAAREDPIEAVRIAVNHSGDSDSTGSIAGAIAGAIHGPSAFCHHLRASGIILEKEDELITMSARLTGFTGY